MNAFADVRSGMASGEDTCFWGGDGGVVELKDAVVGEHGCYLHVASLFFLFRCFCINRGGKLTSLSPSVSIR